MPYYYNRRRPKKSGYRKKFRGYRRASRGRGEKGVRYFKVSHVATNFIATDASGNIALKYCINDPSASSDWASIIALFDLYRVCAFKVKYFPYRPNDVSTSTAYQPLQVCVDFDNISTSAALTVDTNAAYENNKSKNIFMPWSYYVRVPKYSTVHYSGGTAPLPSQQGGFIENVTIPDTGYIYFNSSNLTASESYGTIKLVWYLKVKNRR